jgi:hypothetical protein
MLATGGWHLTVMHGHRQAPHFRPPWPGLGAVVVVRLQPKPACGQVTVQQASSKASGEVERCGGGAA